MEYKKANIILSKSNNRRAPSFVCNVDQFQILKTQF